MEKIPNKREFLNDDDTMPGVIISDFSYSILGKANEILECIYLSIGDCNRTVQLEFPICDFLGVSAVEKSLNKAKRIKSHINRIIEVLEHEKRKEDDQTN